MNWLTSYLMDMCSLDMLATVALSDLTLLRSQDMMVCGCWHSLKLRSDMGGVHHRLFYHRSWWYRPHDFPAIHLSILKTYNLVFSLPTPETLSWQLIADTQNIALIMWTSRSPWKICDKFFNIFPFGSWCHSPCYHSVFKYLKPGFKTYFLITHCWYPKVLPRMFVDLGFIVRLGIWGRWDEVMVGLCLLWLERAKAGDTDTERVVQDKKELDRKHKNAEVGKSCFREK